MKKEGKTKKKKIVYILGITAGVMLMLYFFAPYVMLQFIRQEEPGKDYTYHDSFLNEYSEVRENLTKKVGELTAAGYTPEYYSYPIDEEDGLYIDTILCDSKEEKKNLIVLTTGVHGIEGYVGATMLDVFFDEIYPNLNLADTGVLVVANVNPYGMKHKRRYNENNVDLNRNFIYSWDDFDTSVNKDYPLVKKFLEPKKKLGNAFLHEGGFLGGMLKQIVANGADTISNALLGGQYEYPQGVYYGGNGDEASTAFLKSVFQYTLNNEYENIVHIDLHTGYGPRYNMVIFNSMYEKLTEAETKEAFQYDTVVAYDSKSFYPTTGDTTDYFYRLAEHMGSTKDLFSTCFEFGTLGDGFLDTVKSLKYTVDENRNHWYPSTNSVTNEIMKERYLEMFYPTETKWREKAVSDFIRAMDGVLENKLGYQLKQ